jgi:hypothetical protein
MTSCNGPRIYILRRENIAISGPHYLRISRCSNPHYLRMSAHYLRTTHKHRVLPIGGENDGLERDACGQEAAVEFLRPARSELAPEKQANFGGLGAEQASR